MKILKIRNRIFDLDGEFVEEFSVLGPNHTGMSGCIYGARLPYVGELYHITMSGDVQLNAPVLLKKEFSGGEETGIDAYAKLNLKQLAAMLLQLYMDGEGSMVYSLLKELPFIMAKKMVIPFLESVQVELSPNVTYYRKWPETRLIIGELSIPAPTVSLKTVRMYENYALHIPEIYFGNSCYLIAKPEGRGTIVYKIDNLHNRISGWESFQGYQHPRCEIWFSGEFFSNQFWGLLSLLINQRLGDILFCDEKVAKELNLSPYENWDKNHKISKMKNTIIHEEHGMLKISENWKPYHVPYLHRGHD